MQDIILTDSAIATVTNTQPVSTVTEKYSLIKTDDVISLFQDNGFILSDYQESNYRKAEKEHKVRHLVRMNVASDIDQPVKREVVIMNSHDGTSSFKLNFGAFRMVCNNQLVFGDELLPTERIHHSSQDPWSRIQHYATAIQDILTTEEEMRLEMMNKKLSAYDIEQFAHAAVSLRESDMSKVLDYNAVNLAERPDDFGKTLWLTFNRIQSNILSGNYQKLGIHTSTDGSIHEKYKQAKKLTNQGKIIEINKAIHSLAMELL